METNRDEQSWLTAEEMTRNCFEEQKDVDGKVKHTSDCESCLRHLTHTWKEHNMVIRGVGDVRRKKVEAKEKQKKERGDIKKTREAKESK